MYTKLLDNMKKEMFRRRLSPRTIESYLFCVEKFLKWCRKDAYKIRKKDVKDFLNELALRNKAGSTLNLYQSSIKFMFEEVMHRNFYISMKYSKRPKTLPTVLSQEEVRRLFSHVNNDKHKLMLEIMYGSGLEQKLIYYFFCVFP